MKKIAVVTDSNSGISMQVADEWGIFVIPMPFFINKEEFFEGVNLSQAEFYQKLKDNEDISTSQPSIAYVKSLWNGLLEEYEEIVHIPMSSGLSSACQTATVLSADYEGRVHVINNQRVSVTQKRSVWDALKLAELGKSGAGIKSYLEETALASSIYITVNTLKYLRKGGRITATAAAIGTALRIKPVLQIQGERLDAFAKVRTMKQAKETMIDAIRKDIEERFGGVDKKEMHLDIAHTCNQEAALELKQELMQAFPDYGEIYVDDLSLSVACHIGEGSLAIACTKRFDPSLI